MDQGLVTVIGMSIAYVASFIGLGLAWWAWRRRVRPPDDEAGGRQDPPRDARGTRSPDGETPGSGDAP